MDIIKIRTLVPSKDTIKRVKRQALEQKMFATPLTTKGLNPENTKNLYKSLRKKKQFHKKMDDS